MTIERQWLCWSKPCLPQAASWLIDRFASPGECNLESTVCVLPGARAGRLLIAELLRQCEHAGVRLSPPRVLTPGSMVDHVLADTGAVLAVADAIESHLAWMEGLRRAEHRRIAALLTERPADDDQSAWHDLATTIESLHETLSGELKDFEAAADAAERMSMIGEGSRWRAMIAAQDGQRAVLARAGLVDRHDARRSMLERAIAAAAVGAMPAKEIVLVGVTDLNGLQRATLRLISLKVTSLVHAPESEADAFDDLGAVRTEAWTGRSIEIEDDDITVVERPPHQAQAALRFLAELNGGYAPSQVTLGLGDAALLGDLDVAARWAGLAIHDPGGEPIQRSAPWRLLEAAADWIEERRFEHFATLLRHPDVERWVSNDAEVSASEKDDESGAGQRSIDWLTLLDEYFADHLQGRLTGEWLGDESIRARMKAVHDAVQRMLKPLIAAESDCRPLHEWCQPLLDVLANVYAMEEQAEPAGRDQSVRHAPAAALRSIDATLAIGDAVSEIASIAPELSPTVNATTGLRMMLDMIADGALACDRERHAIEALGWLELHLDTAPVLAIMGFNDGAVPDAVVGHAFLPDSLRIALGLMHNARRFARDAYLLQAIVNSRERVRIIVGRRNAQGDPLAPSRLLLACDDATLVRRISDFARDRSAQSDATPIGLIVPDAGSRSAFAIPVLPALAPPQSMRVTEFRQYLSCPYRYALGRLLRLESLGDAGEELDPMSFGTIAHEALSALGEPGAPAASTDHDEIFAFLRIRLREIVRARFGAHPMPAVQLQIAHLEQRLRSFSRFQARAASEGWRIRHCEYKVAGEVALEFDDNSDPMPLRGTIDRIDHHEATGMWRVIDYKTSENAKSPLQIHHERRSLPEALDDLEWSDLQLPLYHLLVTRGSLRIPADSVELGYIVLPKQSEGVEFIAAEWAPEHLAHGLERAREVVKAIRRGEYGVELMNLDIDAEYDDFARICQSSAFKADGDDDAMGGTSEDAS